MLLLQVTGFMTSLSTMENTKLMMGKKSEVKKNTEQSWRTAHHPQGCCAPAESLLTTQGGCAPTGSLLTIQGGCAPSGSLLTTQGCCAPVGSLLTTQKAVHLWGPYHHPGNCVPERSLLTTQGGCSFFGLTVPKQWQEHFLLTINAWL